MSGKKARGRYRVLAIVWSFAAISMAAGVVRQLPDVPPLVFAILALSVFLAAVWWTAYLRAAKKGGPK